MSTDLRDDAEQHRYELVVDGCVVAFAEYRRRDDRMVLPHTVVDPPLRGRGLGAVLVQGVLDDARRQGLQVVPTCWYVAQFIDEHPEYADLVAS